jgi:nucleotide-binding universal stress UspA family protein
MTTLTAPVRKAGIGPVVVGLDGSPGSAHALRWAAEYARRQDTELVAVHVCEPDQALAPYAPVPEAQAGPEQRRRDDAECLAELVRTTLGTPPAVPVRQVCERANLVRGLLTQAEGASLLVLAPHSGRTTTDGGIGATASDCLRHASCPVVILPPDTQS